MNDYKILLFDEIDSTNDYIYENIKNKNIVSDTVVISKAQTNGHGAYGRSFVSKDTGIYFSLAVFVENEIFALTAKAAVAIFNVLKNDYCILTSIKWINDIYYNDKKVAGILCKKVEVEKNHCYIVGIGIDLYKNEEYGNLFTEKIDEVALVKRIINNIYDLLNDDKIPKEYIKNNLVINKKFSYEDKIYIAKKINEYGNLLARVINEDNKIENSDLDRIFDSSLNIEWVKQ